MLAISRLSKSFNIGTPFEVNIFENFSLQLEENSATAIIGPNGCGKSTLLNIIAGSIKQESGMIELGEYNISSLSEEKRSQYVGRVHQNPSMGVSPSLTILENLAIADKKNEGFTLRPLVRKQRKEYYVDLLKTLDLGLENMLNTKVSLLSGGQRQSLSLLMAAMKHPKLLLLDEHTAALDPKTSRVVMNKTVQLMESNKIATIMITHNMHDAVEFSDRVIMLDHGKVALDERARDITSQDLFAIYHEKLEKMA